MTFLDDDCIFCKITKKLAPAFVIYEDERCIALLDLRQVQPGHTIVIPKLHIDHFMDMENALAAHILEVSQKIAHKIRDALKPLRVGYVVSGFGVAHAHMHVIPLWREHDITSQSYLDVSQLPPVFNVRTLPLASKEESQKILDLIKM